MTDKSLDELFEGLSETHGIEAAIIGEVDMDTKTAKAAYAQGKSEAYDIASSVARDAEDAQADLHQFETISTEKLLRHPERMLYTFEVDAKHRDEFEDSMICEDVEVIDDQTISVTLVTDLPEEL